MDWPEGTLCWAPWRGEPREAVVLRMMKSRVRVHVHGVGVRAFPATQLAPRTVAPPSLPMADHG